MPSTVTAIIAAGRNRTTDYNDGQACDVVIKVFTCIKAAWNRVRTCLQGCLQLYGDQALLADLFLYSYENEFLDKLIKLGLLFR